MLDLLIFLGDLHWAVIMVRVKIWKTEKILKAKSFFFKKKNKTFFINFYVFVQLGRRMTSALASALFSILFWDWSLVQLWERWLKYWNFSSSSVLRLKLGLECRNQNPSSFLLISRASTNLDVVLLWKGTSYFAFYFKNSQLDPQRIMV